MDINILNDFITGTLSSATTAVLMWFLLRKKLSNDNLDVSTNKAENRAIKYLENTRVKLDEKQVFLEEKLSILKDKYDDCLTKNLSLSNDVDKLLTQVKLLSDIIASLQSHLNNTRNTIVGQIATTHEISKSHKTGE